jgi:hypothetical protein
MILEHGPKQIACEVHDINRSSARIVFDAQVEIPDRFRLRVPRRRIDEWVVVRRRGHDSLGVEFEKLMY